MTKPSSHSFQNYLVSGDINHTEEYKRRDFAGPMVLGMCRRGPGTGYVPAFMPSPTTENIKKAGYNLDRSFLYNTFPWFINYKSTADFSDFIKSEKYHNAIDYGSRLILYVTDELGDRVKSIHVYGKYARDALDLAISRNTNKNRHIIDLIKDRQVFRYNHPSPNFGH